MRRIDRRTFLQGSLQLGCAAAWVAPGGARGAAAAGRPAPEGMGALRGRRALVLGGGVAGMAAAQALDDAGASVVVLEPGSELRAELRACGAGPVTAIAAQCDPAAKARILLQFEPVRVLCDAGIVQVRAACGGVQAGDLAVVALSRDALRRLHWSDAELALAMGPDFDGRMRDRIAVTVAQDDIRQRVDLGGDEAAWFDSLAPLERADRLRQWIAAARGVPERRIRVLAIESFRRRKWPLDLGWEPRPGAHRAPRCAQLDPSGHLAFCGSHHASRDGLEGLVESGRDAAARLVARRARAFDDLLPG